MLECFQWRTMQLSMHAGALESPSAYSPCRLGSDADAGGRWQRQEGAEGAPPARPGWAAMLGSADFRAVAVVRNNLACNIRGWFRI